MTSSSKAISKPCPCPNQILDETGGAFVCGFIFGGCFHYFKSAYNSPHGQHVYNGLTAARMNGPRIGGEFAIWRSLVSAGECTMVYLRQKEDPWNLIISGAVTGGLMAVRKGVGVMTINAVCGGSIFALLEGAQIMASRYLTEKPLPQVISDDGARLAKSGEDAGKTWLFFDGTEGLESCDSPKPPTF